MKSLITVFVPSPPWSSTPAEPRLVVNRDILEFFMVLSDSTQVVVWDRDILSPSVEDVGTRIRASGYVSAIASGIGTGIRLAGPRGIGRAIMPIWTDGLLIEDVVTDSAKGVKHANLIALANFKIADSAPWSLVKFKTS